jgi:hypothetical protein
VAKFSVCPSILLNNRKCSHLGVNEGMNFEPRGQISPLGARGEVKNTPQVFTRMSCYAGQQRHSASPSNAADADAGCRQAVPIAGPAQSLERIRLVPNCQVRLLILGVHLIQFSAKQAL